MHRKSIPCKFCEDQITLAWYIGIPFKPISLELQTNGITERPSYKGAHFLKNEDASKTQMVTYELVSETTTEGANRSDIDLLKCCEKVKGIYIVKCT